MPTLIKLPHPSFSQSGMKLALPAFDFFHKGGKRHVEAADVDLDVGDAGCWFYVELVVFKDSNASGYHLTVSHPQSGPVATPAETNNREYVMTIVGGKVADDGLSLTECEFNKMPARILEVEAL